MKPLILIPARLAATRLPDKPLADIGGLPMIVRVYEQAVKANLGPVIVAAGDSAIVEAVKSAGGRAVLTDPALPSGSDRIRAALDIVDPGKDYSAVINLQGDMPFVDPSVLQATLEVLLEDPSADIATLVAPEADPADRTNPDVVKAVLSLTSGAKRGRALYFTRSVLYGDAPVWRHLGVYGYRRPALEAFCAAPPSSLEQREKLEQLRALELGLIIGAAVIAEAPLSVDTPADLADARNHAKSLVL